MSKEKLLILLTVSVVVIITAVAFFPSLFNGFVEWDDTAYLVANDAVKDPSLHNIKKIFTSSFVGHYCPLVIISFAVEYNFFGLNPFAYHLTNYTLHLLVTISVFCFIYLISRRLSIAFIVAVLFGVHPIHVESVAWVAERKDLLYAVFYMLSLISYWIYMERGRKAYYFSCLLFAALSFLSKAMAISLPLMIILLDYFHGRKVDKRSIIDKVPIFVLALIFAAINLYFSAVGGAAKHVTGTGFRIYFTSKAILFYLSKILMPLNLSALYPYHDVTPGHLAEVKYYIAAIILLSACVVFSRKYSKKVIFGSLFSLFAILPALQIIPVGSAYAADRYMYLPSVGIFYILAVFFDKIYHSRIAKSGAVKSGMISLFSLMVISLSVLTWNRCAVWKNADTIFGDIIKKYPGHPLAYYCLGVISLREGDFNEAIKHQKKVLTLDSGIKLTKRGKTLPELARESLTSAYRRREETRDKGAGLTEVKREDVLEDVELLNRLGVEYGKAGNLDKAIALFLDAISIAPDHAESYNNLGYAYYMKGEHKLAEEYFKKALEIDPDHEKARINLEYIRSLGHEDKSE